jgi:predicted DNA-binding transcriptional regulator YafY
MSYALYQERLFWFDRRVRNGRYPNARQLAEKFEISHRTAKRLITFMRDRLCAPLVYDARRRGYAYEDTSFELSQIPIAQEELLAILMARRLLSETAGGFISDAIRRFGDKLMADTASLGLAPDRLRECFSASWHGHSPVSADVFQAVCSALVESRPLEIEYRSPCTTESTRRVVEPHHLRYYMGSWVLFAWCRLRGDWRMFFLSRICSLAIMEETFDPRPFREWQAVLDSAFGLYHSGEHTPVVLRFRPERARFVREQVWHADQRMRDLPDGGLRLSFPVADFAEVKMMILGFGADVVVEEPEALQREVVEEIGRMTGVYGATD